MTSAADLDPRPHLTTQALGRTCEVHRVVASTNDVAFERLEAGAAHGHLVVADEQTGGRGRRGRSWHSPPGVAVYASLVLRGSRPFEATSLVAALGVGLAEGIEAATGLDVGLKWPNDLWVDGRKAGGILVEARGFRPEAPAVVAGFGIDVNQTVFPAGIRGTATSLRLATGRRWERGPLLAGLLAALEPRIDGAMENAGAASDDLASAFRRRSVLVGRRVSLLDGDRPVTGTVEDLGVTSGLVLRSDDGLLLHVPAEHASEVRLA